MKVNWLTVTGALIALQVVAGCKTNCRCPEGLVACYQMDGDARDCSEFGNHGQARSLKFAEDRFGEKGKAASFKGMAACIEVPPSESLHLTNGLTIAVWLKIRGYQNNWAPVLCKGDTRKSREYALSLSRLVEGFYQDENHDSYRNCIGTKVSEYPADGEWHHVAMAYDLKSTRAYLDGRLVGEAPSRDYLNKSGCGVLYIGMDPPGGLEFFNGEMDDLFIFNRPLAIDDIKCVMRHR